MVHPQNGRTSLWGAAEKGHVEVVKVLQEMGADPNIADKVRGEWCVDANSRPKREHL